MRYLGHGTFAGKRLDRQNARRPLGCVEALEARRLLSAAPSFASPVSYTIGAQPSPAVGNISQDGVATGDFNGDKKADLAVVHTADNTVNVLLNKGDGTFAPAVSYPLGSTNTVWVTAADVNKDGKLDLVTLGTKNNAGLIGVLLGNGDGTFKPVVNYAAGGVARGGVAVGDFNRDGKLDLAVAQFAAINGTQSAVDILLNNGDGTFKPFYTVGVPLAARSVTVGDFNKDGKADLAVADGLGSNNQLNSTYPAGVTILLGNGNGTFKSAGQYNSVPTPDAGNDGKGGGDTVNPEFISTADLNNDGKPDLIESLYDHNIDVFLGNGNGTFQPGVGYFTGEYPRSVAVADVNGDGKKDLIVDNVGNSANSSGPEPGSVVILVGNGNGTFQPAVQQNVGFSYPGWLAAADFNGDGRPDLAVTRVSDGHSVNVLLEQPPVQAGAPAVTQVSPASGTTAGGTKVTLTGTNFVGVTAVRFGGVDAASFTVLSATSVVATTPAESAGAVDVRVTTLAGTSPATSGDRFTFMTPATLPAPVIVSPGGTTQPGPVLTTTTPTFTWHAVSGVSGYQLNLFNQTTQKFVSFVINGATATSFTLPPADALTPGDSYVWNLRVLSDGKSGPPSQYFFFQIAK